jgi:hypothetical protein
VPQGGEFEFKNITITELDHQPLFNGRDLTGWEGAETDASACWQVEDGLLVCTGQDGPWLRSQEEYGDFNLRLSRGATPASIVVCLRMAPIEAGRLMAKVRTASKSRSWTTPRTAIRTSRTISSREASTASPLPANTSPAPRASGTRWEINCRGTSYRVTHNGVVIADAKEADFPELANRQTKGYLGLQNHSEHVWFRNLRLGPAIE